MTMMKIMTKMNDQKITLNEVLNDGSRIYVYPDPETGLLVSYGYSAYILSSIKGLKSIASFSPSMQMPVVSFTESEFVRLNTSGTIGFEWSGAYYTACSGSHLPEEDYRSWTKSLRESLV